MGMKSAYILGCLLRHLAIQPSSHPERESVNQRNGIINKNTISYKSLDVSIKQKQANDETAKKGVSTSTAATATIVGVFKQ